MRTLSFKVTVTVDDSDVPMSDIELFALESHLTPESSVVQFGSAEEDHFFLETITVERIEP